jgi:nucleoside-diphosphate-sugar epimerase
VGTVLITGATGFVGGRVVRALRERGDEVVAVVRSPSDELGTLDVDQRLLSLTDLEGIQHAATGAHAIVHAAASSDPATAHAVNVDGTRAVVGAALISGLRLVYVSTTSVYDLDPEDVGTVDEDAPLVTRNGEAPPASSAGSAYATTKAQGEAEVDRAVANGLVGAVLRPPAVLGAGRTSTWGTRVPRRLREGEGDGPVVASTATFGFVHVDDLVDAVLASLDAEPEVVRGMTVNVVGGHVTFGTYREAVRAILPDVPPPPPDPPSAWHGRYATARCAETLDLHLERTFDAAMAEIADAWRDGDPGA